MTTLRPINRMPLSSTIPANISRNGNHADRGLGKYSMYWFARRYYAALVQRYAPPGGGTNGLRVGASAGSFAGPFSMRWHRPDRLQHRANKNQRAESRSLPDERRRFECFQDRIIQCSGRAASRRAFARSRKYDPAGELDLKPGGLWLFANSRILIMLYAASKIAKMMRLARTKRISTSIHRSSGGALVSKRMVLRWSNILAMVCGHVPYLPSIPKVISVWHVWFARAGAGCHAHDLHAIELGVQASREEIKKQLIKLWFESISHT